MRNGRATAAALLVLAAGCARCGRTGGPPPEHFLPANASLVVVVPTLRAAQEQLAPLSRTMASFPAAASVTEILPALRDQLGFDPLDMRGPESAGIDPARGAGLALAPGSAPLLVLPIGDPGRFDDLVARLARDRLGAIRRDSASVAGLPVTTYRTTEGAPPALTMVVTQRTALLSTGADGARAVTGAAQGASGSLATSTAFAAARAAAPPGAALFAFAPAGSPVAQEVALLRDGVAVALTASATRLAARCVVLLSPERREFWRATLAHPEPRSADAPDRFPADAFLVARYEGDPATVARRMLPLAGARAAVRGAGLELDRDVLELLAPGAAAALSLAPTFEVAAVSRASAVGLTDPFRLVLASATFRVKDSARAAAALDRLVTASRPPGFTAERTGERRWRIVFRGAPLDLALDGDRLLVGGGRGSLDGLLAPPKIGYAAPTETSRASLASGAAGVVLDLERLVASFRALPPAAYGSGPDAFVMRSLAERIIEPASHLVAASARLDLAKDAATVDLVVEARPSERSDK